MQTFYTLPFAKLNCAHLFFSTPQACPFTRPCTLSKFNQQAKQLLEQLVPFS